jgi:guanylate kinase
MKKGLLFILSGPSGVGKGTVRMKIMSDPTLNLWYSISLTTRSIRPGEMNGREYYYVSEEEFNRNVEAGNLLEHAGFVGHQYGTPRDKEEEKRNQGINVLMEIDVQGAKQVMAKCPEAVSIFLLPPSFEELEKRIRGRCTECESVIQERLARAHEEMALAKNYKYNVINDSVERAAEEIRSIILNESARAQ